MSTSERDHPSDKDHELHGVDEPLLDFPEFQPEYLFDDGVNPQEVTIFSDDEEELSTSWVSAPTEICWPLEDCR